ncbi:hypothetical protein HELRODRAFT_64799, partial [Helobdella robusta]|uniref:Uncharacterized protein n=1 Tax=Helobdella robusta TaxID=6412 RepID=T1FXZ5_HELRO
FISPKVQMLLSKITGFNINKIFSPKQVSVTESPKYKLVTDEQLRELQEGSLKGANKLLQMPPYKKPWNIHNNDELIISNDQQIAHFEMDDSTYVFTDISPGIPRRDRMLVVRDKEGVLRRCNREESDKILMLYYPQEGKMYNMPQMFQPQQLEVLLGKHQYEYVLNVACVQFEPDDPNYTRVTERTFEHVLQSGQFEVLRFTRFYGSMVFYFLIHNKIDLLLAHQLSQNRLDDAVSLVQLYHIIHPYCKSVAICKGEDAKDNYQLIQVSFF